MTGDELRSWPRISRHDRVLPHLLEGRGIVWVFFLLFFHHNILPFVGAFHVFTIICYMSLVMRKPDFCLCKNKVQISFPLTAKLISAFVFTIRTVQSLFFLKPKFPASSLFPRLYRSVCVGPGQKLQRPVFSRRCSYDFQIN